LDGSGQGAPVGEGTWGQQGQAKARERDGRVQSGAAKHGAPPVCGGESGRRRRARASRATSTCSTSLSWECRGARKRTPGIAGRGGDAGPASHGTTATRRTDVRPAHVNRAK